MRINMRTETIKDYSAIAEVNLLAFRDSDQCFVGEVAMVDTLRHRPDYDPELALVAEVGGRVVGYALFSPCTVYFLGRPTAAVFLAPLAVHPDYQKQGIGGQLLQEGHRRALAKGYKLSILYGHEHYYPRYGYQSQVFSGRGLEINLADIPVHQATLGERPVVPADMERILSIWEFWHKDEPIAMFPGKSLIDWTSHYHNICASTITIGGQVVGYLRYKTDDPAHVLSFLAHDEEAAMAMLCHLRGKLKGSSEESIRLPLNPVSQVVRRLIPCPYESVVRMSVYSMLKVLDESERAVTDYCNYVLSSRENIGVLKLPAQFEWC